MLFSVPLTLSYLGPEKYGLWMTITSLLMFLTFADFGLANGLLNEVAKNARSEDAPKCRTAISTAAVLLTGIAALLLFSLAISYSHIPWARLLNTSNAALTVDGARAASVLFTCVVVGLPFAITQRVQAGHEEVHVSNLWQAVGSALALAAVTSAIYANASLSILVAAAAGAPVAASVLSTWYEFTRRRPELRPWWRGFSFGEARLLLRSGGLFVVLQLAAIVLAAADNVIVGHILGPAEVTALAVPSRLFSVVPLVVGLVLGPLWPAFAAAKAQGDIVWLEKTMARSVALSAGSAGVVSLALVLAGRPVIHAWVGPVVVPSTSLLLALGAWTSLSAVGSAQSVALNGMGVLRVQAATAVLATVLAVGAKVLAARRYGIEGVVWVTVPIYLAVIVAPSAIAARNHLASLRQRGAVRAGGY